MTRSNTFCWVVATTTPISATTGGIGKNGMRNGRGSCACRIRLTIAEIAIKPYSTMISTAVNVTTRIRLLKKHRTVARRPTVAVATHGAPRELTRLRASLIGPGQARSRPLAYVIRPNWSVIASAALKIARIAP